MIWYRERRDVQSLAPHLSVYLASQSALSHCLGRTNLPSPVSSATYSATNSQITFGNQQLSYDQNGNLTSDGVNTYSWNARDQLNTITGNALSASLQYDALGRRTNKTVNGTPLNYLYDGASIVKELSGTTSVADNLTDGFDRIFNRSDATGNRVPLTDVQGSTLSLSDSNGALETDYTYAPFGQTTSTGASSSNSSKFVGREDDGTGLYFNRARFYSPTLQRFINEDPIGYGGGDANVYAYANNDPINLSDGLGFQSQSAAQSVTDQKNWPGAANYHGAAA